MFQIENATTKDIDVIQLLAHQIWPHAYGSILSAAQLQYMLELIYSHSSLQNQMENLHHSFILIKTGSAVIGFASYSPHSDNGNIFHLNKLYVHPSEQGKNAGKQMLGFIIDDIKRKKAISLQLNVNRFNKAIHFYQKNGFYILREEDIDIGHGYLMNDYILEKKL